MILFVCSVCPHDNSKTNDPKVFKLGIVNDLGISYKYYAFGLKGQRSRSQVTKCKVILKVIEWPGVSYALYRVQSLDLYLYF